MTKSKLNHIPNYEIWFKDVSDDNWAPFYTFPSEVSEEPGFRNNYFFQIRSTTRKEGASTIQSIWYLLRSEKDF